MKFKQFIVIGKGRVAKECVLSLERHFQKPVYVEFEPQNKALYDEYFKDIKNALIISANNFYLFSPQTTQNNTIINYHNALLPKHRGVNAHIWAIWENDELSGISWHLVDSGIDTGKILIQKAIKLNKNTTARELLLVQHKLAINSFDEALSKLNNKEFITGGGGVSSFHKRTDMPNNAILELAWEEEKISRFLRAFDIGAFREGVSLPKLEIFGKKFEVLFYEFSQKALTLRLQDNFCINIKKG